MPTATRAEQDERPQACAVAGRAGVDQRSEEERGKQDERLEPHRGRTRRPRGEDAVAPHRRLLQSARHREEGGGDDGERQRLGHQEAGVVQRRAP